VRRATILSAIIALSVTALALTAQDKVKQLDPAKARVNYSFPVQPGAPPFRFHVELDFTSTITGVSVFRPGDAAAYQVLPTCPGSLKMELTEEDATRDLLKHADLNFDTFEDLELLQYHDPHVAKSVYCIYTWDPHRKRFRPAPDIPDTDPVPHPETKTVTVHEDWFGGAYADRTYRWFGSKIVLTDESGSLAGSESAGCAFTDYCSKLIKGKMVEVATRPYACPGAPQPHLDCAQLPDQSKKK
jgi:hypothetical protein